MSNPLSDVAPAFVEMAHRIVWAARRPSTRRAGRGRGCCTRSGSGTVTGWWLDRHHAPRTKRSHLSAHPHVALLLAPAGHCNSYCAPRAHRRRHPQRLDTSSPPRAVRVHPAIIPSVRRPLRRPSPRCGWSLADRVQPPRDAGGATYQLRACRPAYRALLPPSLDRSAPGRSCSIAAHRGGTDRWSRHAVYALAHLHIPSCPRSSVPSAIDEPSPRSASLHVHGPLQRAGGNVPPLRDRVPVGP